MQTLLHTNYYELYFTLLLVLYIIFNIEEFFNIIPRLLLLFVSFSVAKCFLYYLANTSRYEFFYISTHIMINRKNVPTLFHVTISFIYYYFYFIFLLLIVSLFFFNILVSFSIRILSHFHACIHHQLQRRLNITLRGLFPSIRSLYAASFTSLIVNSFLLLFVLIHTMSNISYIIFQRSFVTSSSSSFSNFFYVFFSYFFLLFTRATPIAKFLVYYFLRNHF